MTWTDPEALKADFQTNDVPPEAKWANVLDDLLSVPHLLDITTSTDDWANLGTAEHTFYSVTVPANAMGANGSVHMQMRGDYLKNNVDADTLIFRIKFGGGTLWQDTFGTIGVSADRMPWRFDVDLYNLNSASSQFLSGNFLMMDPNSGAADIGIGPMVNTGTSVGLFMGLPSITTLGSVATTSNQTLLVSVQWSASSANNSWRRRLARTLIAQN